MDRQVGRGKFVEKVIRAEYITGKLSLTTKKDDGHCVDSKEAVPRR